MIRGILCELKLEANNNTFLISTCKFRKNVKQYTYNNKIKNIIAF